VRRTPFRYLVIGGLVAGMAFLVPAATASADVVKPPGACTATGHWLGAGFTKNSTDYNSNDVIVIPQKDVVDWEGHELGKPIGYFGPARPIDGAVTVTLPFDIKVNVWHWGGDKSPRYSNKGQESYNVPSALIGIKLQLSGFEKDNHNLVCSGSVYLEVAGSKTKNPIGWGGVIGSVIFAAGLLFAGFRKTRLAYDDINP
jgi:hypothetical protein